MTKTETGPMLVRFVEEGSGDVAAARGLLRAVLNAGDATVVSDAPGVIDRWSSQQVESFLRRVRRFLHQVVHGTGHQTGAFVPEIRINGLRIGCTSIGAGDVMLTVDGEPEAVLWFQVIDLIRAVGLTNIRRCGECQKVFVRVGKMTWCSTTCGRNARARKFYEQNAAKISEQRHARYAAQVKKRQPRAKVLRRRRKSANE